MKCYFYGLALLTLISCGLKPSIQSSKLVEQRGSVKYSTSIIDSGANSCQEYSRFNAQKVLKYSYSNFNALEQFRYGNLYFLFGRYLSEPKNLPKGDYGGFRLLAINENGELVFRSKGAGDSRNFSPQFFKLNDSAPIFILVDIGDEGGSWGNRVFSIFRNNVTDVGTIDIAKRIYRDGEQSLESIGEYTRIIKKNDVCRFSFSTDSVTFDPLGNKEITLDARKLHYIYENNQFRLIGM